MASTPQGRCVFCGNSYSSRGISRHLANHLKALPSHPKKQALHLKVTGIEPYYLHLLVDQHATLGQLDIFLRRIWLECCHHLSAFDHRHWRDELPWDMAVGRAIAPDDSIEYAYDFGSTTRLTIKCLQRYPVVIKDDPIFLLSRNEPLGYTCHYCQQNPATTLSPFNYNHEEGTVFMFCEDCKAKHEEIFGEEDYLLPVANSPRMGVCGYDGGTIDQERDLP